MYQGVGVGVMCEQWLPSGASPPPSPLPPWLCEVIGRSHIVTEWWGSTLWTLNGLLRRCDSLLSGGWTNDGLDHQGQAGLRFSAVWTGARWEQGLEHLDSSRLFVVQRTTTPQVTVLQTF